MLDKISIIALGVGLAAAIVDKIYSKMCGDDVIIRMPTEEAI